MAEEKPNPFGSEYNAEFSRKKMMEFRKMSNQYKTAKLTAKIEESGSMYGKSAAEVSEAVAELRKAPQIPSVASMFADNKISSQYEGFQKKAIEIFGKDEKKVEEAAIEKMRQKAEGRKQSIIRINARHNVDSDDGQARGAEERIVFEKAQKKPGLHMGQIKK